MAADRVTELLTGLALQLQADLVGTYNPSGATTSGTVIALRTAPVTPDKVIVLSEYAIVQRPGLTEALTAVNVLCRGDQNPNTAAGMANDVYLSLQGRRGALPNGALIVQMWQQSEARIGPDSNRRHERSVNFYVQWNRAHQGAT